MLLQSRKKQPSKTSVEAQQMSNLQTALEALENRNDRENKANCKLARMMQVKDKKYVDEH